MSIESAITTFPSRTNTLSLVDRRFERIPETLHIHSAEITTLFTHALQFKSKWSYALALDTGDQTIADMAENATNLAILANESIARGDSIEVICALTGLDEGSAKHLLEVSRQAELEDLDLGKQLTRLTLSMDDEPMSPEAIAELDDLATGLARSLENIHVDAFNKGTGPAPIRPSTKSAGGASGSTTPPKKTPKGTKPSGSRTTPPLPPSSGKKGCLYIPLKALRNLSRALLVGAILTFGAIQIGKAVLGAGKVSVEGTTAVSGRVQAEKNRWENPGLFALDRSGLVKYPDTVDMQNKLAFYSEPILDLQRQIIESGSYDRLSTASWPWNVTSSRNDTPGPSADQLAILGNLVQISMRNEDDSKSFEENARKFVDTLDAEDETLTPLLRQTFFDMLKFTAENGGRFKIDRDLNVTTNRTILNQEFDRLEKDLIKALTGKEVGLQESKPVAYANVKGIGILPVHDIDRFYELYGSNIESIT